MNRSVNKELSTPAVCFTENVRTDKSSVTWSHTELFKCNLAWRQMTERLSTTSCVWSVTGKMQSNISIAALYDEWFHQWNTVGKISMSNCDGNLKTLTEINHLDSIDGAARCKRTRHLMQCVSKSGPLRLLSHNFTNARFLVILVERKIKKSFKLA